MKEDDRPRVLILDDDEDLRRLVVAALGRKSYQLLEADNGRDGLALAFVELPDIILLDRQMPGIDGLEVLRNLRANLTTRHIPVILLTAMWDIDQRVQGLQSGADDYVTKPFSPPELAARVEANLRRARSDLIADPLTKLPGNLVLRQELGRRLEREESFSICYADLDNFKAYVDHYGFERASEVIQRLAQVIYNCWVEQGDQVDFIGHIGGDDFLILAGQERAEPLSIAVIDGFLEKVPEFYGEGDRLQGYIEGVDRYGVQRRFPLLSITVAIIDVQPGDFTDRRELAAFAARCKDKLKQRGKETQSWKHYRCSP